MSRRPFAPEAVTEGRPDKTTGRSGGALPAPPPREGPASRGAVGTPIAPGPPRVAGGCAAEAYPDSATPVRGRILRTGRVDALRGAVGR